MRSSDVSVGHRHVILPQEITRRLPNPMRLLKEDEWRGLGVQQSRGWEHYEIHKPEPHVLLFRRLLGTDPRTGQVDEKLRQKAVAEIQAAANE